MLAQRVCGGFFRDSPDARGVGGMDFGATLLGRGKQEEAVEQFQAALQEQPDNVVAHRGLATKRLQQQRLEEAARYFEELLQLKPDDVSAMNDLGQIRLKQGRLPEAAELFRRALSIFAGLAAARAHLESIIELTKNK